MSVMTDSTDRELTKVTNALEERMKDLLESSPRAMHPLWNYILTDLAPILRWTEIYCNSSRILLLIQRLLKLPPLTFALIAFAGLVIGLKKCLKMDARLTTNLLAVAYPTFASLKSLESTNWITYWCIYGWSTLTDQISPLLQDPVKSYYIPKMLFFYWMSSKGGANILYHNVISRVLKTNCQSNSIAQADTRGEINTSDIVKKMSDEEVEDSILESVQKSENDECTFSDHDECDESNSEEETLQSNADETVVEPEGLKKFQSQVQFTMSSITVTGTLDQAPEAAE